MTPFLDTTTIFLSTASHIDEKELREELWVMHKYMKLSLTELYSMPIVDRKTYLKVHNKICEEEEKQRDDAARK